MDEKTIPFSKLPVDVKAQLSKKKGVGLNLDYHALFEQMGECVFIIGLDLKCIAANPQALRLLGYEEIQLMGLPVAQLSDTYYFPSYNNKTLYSQLRFGVP